MLAYEHFRKFLLKEILLIIAMAGITAAVILLAVTHTRPYLAIIISLAAGVVGMNLVVHALHKSGSALLFYFILALFTLPLDDLGVTGWDKIWVYLLAGVSFELIFMLLKIKIHNIPLDVVIGTSFSTLLIVFFSAAVILARIPDQFPLDLINLLIVAFFVGLAFSTLAFIFWFIFSNYKSVIRFRNYLLY